VNNWNGFNGPTTDPTWIPDSELPDTAHLRFIAGSDECTLIINLVESFLHTIACKHFYWNHNVSKAEIHVDDQTRIISGRSSKNLEIDRLRARHVGQIFIVFKVRPVIALNITSPAAGCQFKCSVSKFWQADPIEINSIIFGIEHAGRPPLTWTRHSFLKLNQRKLVKLLFVNWN